MGVFTKWTAVRVPSGITRALFRGSANVRSTAFLAEKDIRTDTPSNNLSLDVSDWLTGRSGSEQTASACKHSHIEVCCHLQVVNSVERKETGVGSLVDGGAGDGGGRVGRTHGSSSGDLSVGLYGVKVESMIGSEDDSPLQP
jgi:hypothetical protein